MPVTFRPARHEAESIDPYDYSYSSDDNATTFLKQCSRKEHAQCKEMIRTSFPSNLKNISPSNNGFVHSAILAYNNHHNLILRPDDIWLAILTQFNIYVNAHPEQLRHHFVAHNGQKELVVVDEGTTETYDWSLFPRKMSSLLEENVLDPTLRNWIIPTFSTTTETDITVCSIAMMSTLQHYFSYKCMLKCGIPSVTLLGERKDWEDILQRLEKLPSFGEEPEQWSKLLKAVLRRFATSFDIPDHTENKEFWQRIAHQSGGGSGPTYLSGWLTAFCFWDGRGKFLGSTPGSSVLGSEDGEGEEGEEGEGGEEVDLVLDGVVFHHVDMDDIAPGWVAVPVKVDDQGIKYCARMVAGSMGFECLSSGGGGGGGGSDGRGGRGGRGREGGRGGRQVFRDGGRRGGGGGGASDGGGEGEELDTLQPRSGWMMFKTFNEERGEEERRRDYSSESHPESDLSE